METKEVTCQCGQPNSLVLIDGRWCYDKARHGHIEDIAAENRCVNCGGPLEKVEPPVTEGPEPGKGGTGDEPPERQGPTLAELKSLKKAVLVAMAEDRPDIELPEVATKKQIIELLAAE